MLGIMPEKQLILLAEDDENDAFLVRRALEAAGIVTPVYVVLHGDEVIAYLKGVGKYANRAEYPLPSLLVIDLKMPRKNGLEVLQWIRSEDTLRPLRVIVLTGSARADDRNRAYELGANSFLEKPADFKELVTLSKLLYSYWLLTDLGPELGCPETETRTSG
jgi:CheY-like chemotaxis protein